MPDSLLFLTSSVMKERASKRTYGINAVNSLLCKCKYFMVDRLAQGGMDVGPILFSKRSKKRSLLSLQKPVGISPSKEFLDKTSEVNNEKLPIQLGITPENELLPISNNSREELSKSPFEISPEILLFSKNR